MEPHCAAMVPRRRVHAGPAASLALDRDWQLERLAALLDAALRHVRGGNCRHAFRLLGAPLSALRSDAAALGAQAAFTAHARRHPLFDVVQQDPFTRRAFEKPRGFAGDAVMLDFVYDGVPPHGTGLLGKQCFLCTTRGPSALSLNHRRLVLRACVDHAVASAEDFRILAVAGGHCRELEGSLLMQRPCRGELVALDADAAACNRMRDAFAGHPVRIEHGALEAATARGRDLGRFDLVYSPGLLDRLPQPVARQRVARLFEMLRPGGRMLLASFVPDNLGRGYMETMMDWRPVHRTEPELLGLVPDHLPARARTFTDPHGNIAYTEVRRDAR